MRLQSSTFRSTDYMRHLWIDDFNSDFQTWSWNDYLL